MSFTYDAAQELYFWVDSGLVKAFHESGDLYSVTHGFGETLVYHYEANVSPARLEKITHSYGGELAFAYDSQDRVSVITGSDGKQFKYFYDSLGNLDYVDRPAKIGVDIVDYSYLVSAQHPNDNLLSEISYPQDSGTYARFDYNSVNQAVTTEHMISQYTSVEKVQFAQIASSPSLKLQTTNPNGKKTTYTYDDIAGLKRLTRVDGVAHGTCVASNSTYTYDAYGFYDKVTDEEGNVVDYDYNQQGHLLSVTTGHGTAEARTVTMTNDPVWNKVDSISTPLIDTDLEIDIETGRITKVTQTNKSQYGVANQQRVTNITYETHPNSNIVKKTTIDGPRADVDDYTFHNYDTNGRLTSVVRKVSSALSLTTTYSNFDNYGRPKRITTPTGMTRDLTYGPKGRVLSLTDTVDGQARLTAYEYNHSGDLTLITNPDGSVNGFGYDQARRLTSTGQNGGSLNADDVRWRAFQYDTASNMTNEQIYERDWTWVSDPNCNPFVPPFPECGGSFQIDTVLRYEMAYEYDSLNRLIKKDWGYSGREEEFTYLKNNHLHTTKDGYDRSTTFSYDANNGLEDTTYRDGGVSEVVYDDNGQVSGVRDAVGQWTYYHRDGFGNAWQIVSPATGTTNYEYDLAGNQTKKTDARGKIRNAEYDALGRLISVKLGTSTTPIHTFEYDTDRPGYLYRVSDDAGTHTYTRNQAGDVLTKTEVVAGETLSTTNRYDVHGRLDRITYPSGLQVDYQFDIYGDVEAITAQGVGLALSNVVTSVVRYPWGPIKRFVYGNGESRAQNLTKYYALTQIVSGAHMSPYFYRDLNGNITGFDGRTYTYDEMDRLATHTGPDGDYEYDYDFNGNRNWHKRNSVLTNYNYNTARTRLNSLSGGSSETRVYDANGNTIQIGSRYFDHDDTNRFWRYREGSVTVTYTHNAFGERQLKQQGSTTTRFVYEGPSLLHERVGSMNRDYIYLAGEIVGLVKNGVLYYIHNDHIGRPQFVSDSSKSVVWSSQNNAFGNTPGTDLIGNFNVGFPGQYYDIESGTYYNYHRTYDELTGRYLQSDPIGLNGGLNTYSYAAGNPLSYIDPYGLHWVPGAARNSDPKPISDGAGEVISVVLCEIGPAGRAVGIYEFIDNPSLMTAVGILPGGRTARKAGSLSDANKKLPDDTPVCRGGSCKAENFENATGAHVDEAGNLQNVSVNSAPGKSIDELTEGIPHKQVGTTTVGDVRAAGGDVVSSRTTRNPNHATMSGVSSETAEDLFTPTIPNPNK